MYLEEIISITGAVALTIALTVINREGRLHAVTIKTIDGEGLLTLYI
jgi:hypothetical protein